MAIRDDEISIAFNVARKAINDTGYGGWVKDQVITDLVSQVVDAIDKYRATKNASPAQ